MGNPGPFWAASRAPPQLRAAAQLHPCVSPPAASGGRPALSLAQHSVHAQQICGLNSESGHNPGSNRSPGARFADSLVGPQGEGSPRSPPPNPPPPSRVGALSKCPSLGELLFTNVLPGNLLRTSARKGLKLHGAMKLRFTLRRRGNVAFRGRPAVGLQRVTAEVCGKKPVCRRPRGRTSPSPAVPARRPVCARSLRRAPTREPGGGVCGGGREASQQVGSHP